VSDLRARIENDFRYHETSHDQQEKLELVRQVVKIAADRMVIVCPEGRELSTALTRLEEAMFHANAAIARQPRG
jgi:Rad3-related DNA helicase